jgi:hypothetical protein
MFEEYATTPAQPTDMVMPTMAQTIFTFGNIVPVVVIGFLAFRYAQANKTPLPYYLLIGGAFAVLMEPVVDVLGLCYFPHEGSWGAFRAFDVTIPMFLVPVYLWYVGGQAFLTYKVLENGITTAGLFKMWAIFAVVNGILETPPILMGIYTYYGAQPFQLFGFPWWWTFCNALMPIAAGAIAFRIKPYLPGWRLALLIPIVPMACGLINGAVSWPTWLALNSGVGYWATYPAAIISFILGAIAVYILSILVAKDSPALNERSPTDLFAWS